MFNFLARLDNKMKTNNSSKIVYQYCRRRKHQYP